MASYRKPDTFTKQAKSKGFPARSVFKLEEIDHRVSLLRGGLRVLDLGASPGSWSLYAAQRISRSGHLLAVDLKPLQQVLPPQCTFVQGDAFGVQRETLAMYAPYDVVLSDMAPNTTGNRLEDQTASFDLFCFALELAIEMGGEGSHFCGKIFMGPDFPLAKNYVKKAYETVRIIRPESVRTTSFEIFIVGLKKRRAEVEPEPETNEESEE
jgi:23S rRNA (uridine2552-2'-O)-methyltransferase